MARTPLLFDDPFDFHRPSWILDQHFGLVLTPDDLLAPFSVPRSARAMVRCPAGYIRPWRTLASKADAGSTIQFDKEKFQANLDVQQFSPNETTVKVSDDNEITTEGKHEEKQDEHGYTSRQFVRRYVLPKEQKQIEHCKIPVTQTGKPSKPIEVKK